MQDTKGFQQLRFKFPFRKHQELILEKFTYNYNNKKDNPFKFHVISPPGSGKTIAGIEMAIRLGCPALIMCPNTAIQGQWMDKVSMFFQEETSLKIGELVSSEPQNIRLLNVFTYQALSIPDNGNSSMVSIAENIWADYLSSSMEIGLEEALDRIFRMKESNYAAYAKELAKFNKKLRKGYLGEIDADLFKVLHPNARKLILRFQEEGIKTVIFDECHHLQNYWALVMSEIIRKLETENIIGLTATPPMGEELDKLECYTQLMGDIDFQIPTPAVVKEGMLAPYQDLVYFCTPSGEEFEFIKNSHYKFKELTKLFDKPESDFYYWVVDRIVYRKLITGETQEWTKFINSRPGFATAGVKYLLKHNYTLPWDITVTEPMYSEMVLEDWCCLIEDYALNLLKISSKEEDKKLYDNIRDALRSMGAILSEKGVRAYSSPMDRVLAYSKNKLQVVKVIVKNEMKSMGDKLRVAIITDFEHSNALSLKRVDNVLDEESGGAISVIKALVSDPETDKLDPVMVTGSNLLCDDDFAETYVVLGNEWVLKNSLEISFSIKPASSGNFAAIVGTGKDWSSKVAVLFTTYLLENGITKCIIGTRGLLGEGWDSIKLNTLIDLTTVTTFASVNQLRGRSIRKNPEDVAKLSNNWDVICIAPNMEKGYNDLDRLYRKHDQFYGICDDGQIQSGINHLDGSLSFGETQLMVEELGSINERMLSKALDREAAYKLWKIGEKYDNLELGCCELKILKPIKMKVASVYKNKWTILNSKLRGSILSIILSLSSSYASVWLYSRDSTAVLTMAAVAAVFGLGTYFNIASFLRFGKKNFFELSIINSVEDICKCVFSCLKECGFISSECSEKIMAVSEREDGSIRIHLDGDQQNSTLFSNSVAEILAPIEDQRYAIERYEVSVPEEKMNKILYIIRYGFNKYDPILMCYHPIPNAFSSKDKAIIFKKNWNKYVSPGDIVYLKGEKGKKIIETYGRTNFLGVKKQSGEIWK